MSEHSTSQLATLIQLGKEQGYLTYAEINDQLPESVTESDQIDDIIQMLTDVGIKILRPRLMKTTLCLAMMRMMTKLQSMKPPRYLPQ